MPTALRFATFAALCSLTLPASATLLWQADFEENDLEEWSYLLNDEGLSVVQEPVLEGQYAGRVDDFDGFFQSLRIEEGPHTIEIVARGYQTLIFNVRIVAGRQIDYKADLRPY